MPKVKLWTSPDQEQAEFRRRMVDSKRGARGYHTQKALADAAGVQQVALSMRMSGKTKWDVDTLSSLDRVLRFSAEELSAFIRGGKRHEA